MSVLIFNVHVGGTLIARFKPMKHTMPTGRGEEETVKIADLGTSSGYNEYIYTYMYNDLPSGKQTKSY